MDIAQVIHDGANTQALLENPVFQTAFAELEAEIIEAWKTNLNPTEREALWQRLQAMQELQAKLQEKLNLAANARYKTTQLQS